MKPRGGRLEGREHGNRHVNLGCEPGVLEGIVDVVLATAMEPEMLEGIVQAPDPPVARSLAQFLGTTPSWVERRHIAEAQPLECGLEHPVSIIAGEEGHDG